MVVDFFTFLSRREYELCRKIQRERVNLWVPVKSAKKRFKLSITFFFISHHLLMFKPIESIILSAKINVYKRHELYNRVGVNRHL